ncbi:MAG: preprotein translocase subunit SecA [Mycoplasma sp.]
MLQTPDLAKKITKSIKRISPSVRVLDKATEIADFVLTKEEFYASKSDLQLKRISYDMMSQIADGALLDNFLIDGLAIAREMIFRVYGLKAYRVQLIGAIVAHFGDFSEMKTGEGKTLTLLLVSYVNALSKKGVHIVTVNEYLVKRDMEFSQKALGELGITVGYVTSEMSPVDKKRMYACDITYISNSELGFDYLRDNMINDYSDKMQRELNFAIVDEADSILVDEARTPLIIAGNPTEDISQYIEVDDFVKTLTPDDYVVDMESQAINLNDNGVEKAEKFFKIKNLYDIENSETVHKLMNALRAHFVMLLGKEYIIKYNSKENKNEIALVDSFTGRVMEGRMYAAGLHQAIQAKERVEIDPENVTLATITYQSFFRLYKKLAGLSGTAMTEKQEFLDIYNMVVVEIPTNKELARIDYPDYVFGSKQLKWKYVVADIKRRHERGQPILVGTVSVEDSELIHRLLDHVKIPHKILNAKNHSLEANIIKEAGQKGAVTIATNMAGRGTDIKLGEGVKELGGLFVLGTERNESRRIDNQLRGRSGRQGDIGESRFFISLQDSLFKRFASDRFDKAQYKMGEDVIDLKFFSRLLDKTQRRVENQNYDIRKNLIDYDYVLTEQRELFYKQRNSILMSDDIHSIINKMIPKIVDVLIIINHDEENTSMVHIDSLFEDIKNKINIDLQIDKNAIQNLHNKDIFKIVTAEITEIINQKFLENDEESTNVVWRKMLISSMDTNWTHFLDKISKLRDGVALRSYEQKAPLNIYIEDSDRLFYNITITIAEETIKSIVSYNKNANFADAYELSFIDDKNINKDFVDTPITTINSINDLRLSSPIKKPSNNDTIQPEQNFTTITEVEEPIKEQHEIQNANSEDKELLSTNKNIMSVVEQIANSINPTIDELDAIKEPLEKTQPSSFLDIENEKKLSTEENIAKIVEELKNLTAKSQTEKTVSKNLVPAPTVTATKNKQNISKPKRKIPVAEQNIAFLRRELKIMVNTPRKTFSKYRTWPTENSKFANKNKQHQNNQNNQKIKPSIDKIESESPTEKPK